VFLEHLDDKIGGGEFAGRPFQNVCGGTMKQTLKCHICGKVVIRYPRFVELSVNLSGHTNAQDLLNSFFQSERLEDYTCSVCHLKGGVERTLEIITFPKVLIVLVPRFTASGAKNNSQIGISPTVTLTNISARTGVSYSFQSAVIHHGPHIQNGHYTSLCNESLSLVTYDDSKVSMCNRLQGGQKEGAYILMYEKRLLEVESPVQKESQITGGSEKLSWADIVKTRYTVVIDRKQLDFYLFL